MVSLSALFVLVTVCPNMAFSRFAWSENFYLLLTLQLLLGFGLLAITSIVISTALSGLRNVSGRMARGQRKGNWRWLSPDGVAVAAALTTAWLVLPGAKHTYVNPSGKEYIEIRSPSLLEGPLGVNACSDVFVPVSVKYVGGKHPNRVCLGYEGREEDAANRAKQRQILWGSGTPARAVVVLPETGTALFFPEPMPDSSTPTDRMIKAYLKGDTQWRIGH